MMKQKSHRSIPASCKRLFHKLGVAVALSSALAGCPSVPTPISYVKPEPVSYRTKQEEVIFTQTDLVNDCYCVEKQRKRNPKDFEDCQDIYIYKWQIISSTGFSARAILGQPPLPETEKIELDQSIVDFCVSAILRSKETTPIKDVVSRTQPDKK